MFIACLFNGSQEQSFFLQTLLFTAFLATVLKILTYSFVSTWSLVSSAWEHVKRKMHPCWSETWIHKISPCRCYATICKIRPLRPKSEFLSNILFVTLWHPEGHAGSSPVRIDVNHQKSSLGKFEKSDWSVLTKYKDLWHHGKPFFLSFGTKKPRSSPAPLSHLCSQLQCGNIVSIKTLIVCKHCCMVKAQWYLLWLQLCQIGPPPPASVHNGTPRRWILKRD